MRWSESLVCRISSRYNYYVGFFNRSCYHEEKVFLPARNWQENPIKQHHEFSQTTSRSTESDNGEMVHQRVEFCRSSKTIKVSDASTSRVSFVYPVTP